MYNERFFLNLNLKLNEASLAQLRIYCFFPYIRKKCQSCKHLIELSNKFTIQVFDFLFWRKQFFLITTVKYATFTLFFLTCIS